MGEKESEFHARGLETFLLGIPAGEFCVVSSGVLDVPFVMCLALRTLIDVGPCGFSECSNRSCP